MWMYIIGGVILFEILGGLFFYSLISVSHKADQQLGAIRRSRITVSYTHLTLPTILLV